MKITKTFIYSKKFLEFFLIFQKVSNFKKIANLELFIIISIVLNVLRSLFKCVLKHNFNFSKKLPFYNDILILEEKFSTLFTGESVQKSINLECLNNKNDSKVLFSLLSDCPEMKKKFSRLFNISSFADIFSTSTFHTSNDIQINDPHLNKSAKSLKIMTGKITEKSLAKYFADPGKILKILTQGFDSELDFQDFHDNFRQFKIEKQAYLNFNKENQNIILILNTITCFIFLFSEFAIFIQLLSSNSLVKLVVFPFILFLLPLTFNIIDSFLFLIFNHSFDINDRINIEDENLIVKSITLTSTIFEKWNNEIVIYSNKHLKKQILKNIKRSKNQYWNLNLLINSKDSSKVNELEYHLKEYCKNTTILKGIILSYNEILDSSFIKLNLQIKHAINYQNGYFMWYIQNKFMKRLLYLMKNMNIRYYPQEQPIFTKPTAKIL
jgi:small-conductance mechanosensitive channel